MDIDLVYLLTCPEHSKATAKMVEAAVVPKIREEKKVELRFGKIIIDGYSLSISQYSEG